MNSMFSLKWIERPEADLFFSMLFSLNKTALPEKDSFCAGLFISKYLMQTTVLRLIYIDSDTKIRISKIYSDL